MDQPALLPGGGRAPCHQEAGQERIDPSLTVGFFVAEGPVVLFSTLDCRRSPEPPEAGSVVVSDDAGAVIASTHVSRGHLLTIALAPGTYTLAGTFQDATINGLHPSLSEQIVIPAGKAVRRDLILPLQ